MTYRSIIKDTTPYSLIRRTAGAIVNHRQQPATEETLTIEGSLQPWGMSRGKKYFNRPDGAGSNDAQIFVSENNPTVKIRTADQYTNEMADKIIHNGQRYTAHQIMDWSLQGSLIAHYEVLFIRDQTGRGYP